MSLITHGANTNFEKQVAWLANPAQGSNTLALTASASDTILAYGIACEGLKAQAPTELAEGGGTATSTNLDLTPTIAPARLFSFSR